MAKPYALILLVEAKVSPKVPPIDCETSGESCWADGHEGHGPFTLVGLIR